MEARLVLARELRGFVLLSYLEIRCGRNVCRKSKKTPFWICAFLLDVRRVFRIAAELVFILFYPPICGGNRRECGGNRRECGGISRIANGVAAFLFCLRRLFLFAADFLECGRNFRRNALRQKFPPQEVLGIHTYIHRHVSHIYIYIHIFIYTYIYIYIYNIHTHRYHAYICFLIVSPEGNDCTVMMV